MIFFSAISNCRKMKFLSVEDALIQVDNDRNIFREFCHFQVANVNDLILCAFFSFVNITAFGPENAYGASEVASESATFKCENPFVSLFFQYESIFSGT